MGILGQKNQKWTKNEVFQVLQKNERVQFF